MRPLSRFAHLMSSQVQIAARTGQDAYGKPTYGAATTYAAHLFRKPRMVFTAEGQQVVSSQTLYVNTTDPILTSAQVTLSTGDIGSTQDSILHPPISVVDTRFDESGKHHVVIMLA